MADPILESLKQGNSNEIGFEWKQSNIVGPLLREKKIVAKTREY
jgi:hypothetical protein